MRAATSDRAATIFLALSHAPPDDHVRLLDEQCAGDADLRREVERLLRGLNEPDSLLDHAPSGEPARGRLSHSAGALIGDFIVIRQIGAGGTGVVYLAHQQHPPRIVALKVLREEFVASTVQRRFEIEAELLGHLHHPGIAQIYAAHPGDPSTPPFIAMELVNGPPITEYCESRRLPIRDRVDLVARACDAVQHAHQRGIIHRDLKPGNILVNEDGHPKVLDFGVARTMGAQVSLTTIETETGQLVGTLAYMSPEQVEATPQAIDTRTDIHALGVILFRLLTGRLPFGYDHPALPELARRILRDEPPRLGTIDPALRGDLEVIVARALAKEKERRYASAADFATDLRRYLAGEPIAASHDSAWYVVRRRLRRYRLAFALSAAAGVALAGLAFYASVQRARADRVNVEVQQQLATSTIERGRLLSVTGNMPIAEELVWRELFRAPDSRHAQWGLWDIYSREPSLWSSAAHEGGTLSIRFSPDGRHLATVGQFDGLVRLFDVASGHIVRTFGAPSYGGTRRALFTPDGSRVVTGSKDGTIRVWDVNSGELRREIAKAIQSLDDLALFGAGEYAVTVGGGTLQVWSLSSGEWVADLSTLAAAGVVAADPGGTLIVAGSNDGTVTAIDFTSRKRVWRHRAHRGQAISLAVEASRRQVASGGTDSFIHLWHADTGHLVRTIATENGSVRNMNFDRGGAAIAAAGQWRTKLWHLDDPERPPQSFGSAQGMTDVDITPDGRFLANCHGAWGLVRLWDVSADARTDHWAGHASMVTGVVVAGSAAIASAAVEGTVSLWQSGHATPRFTFQPGARVSGLAIDDTKRWIVSVGQPGTASVWDARDGRRVATLSDAGASRAALFVDGNRRLIIGDVNGTLEFWEWADGSARDPRRVSSPGDGEVLTLASHGSRLFVAHRETMIVIRDVASGAEIRRMRPTASPFSLAVSPDGRLLASGTWPGVIDLWNAETGEKLDALKGPTALVHGLDFSPDGSLLVLSSRDGSTRLWDVAAKQWLATVASRRVGAERVRFLPDGRRVAIGYEDGEIEIRDLQYFFRFAAGHAEYQLRALRGAGEAFPRGGEVLAWSRQILSPPRH